MPKGLRIYNAAPRSVLVNCDEETAAWIELSLVPQLGPATFRELLKAFGLPRDVLRTKRSALAAIVPDALAERIGRRSRPEALEHALVWLEDRNRSLITLADERYPAQLLEISDPPPLLYVQGDPSMLARPSLAVVGSRNATPQGRANAENFSRALSESGLCIVSGLAHGVDSAAHRGALQGAGGTIAVLGTGADIVYPRANHDLAKQIAAEGALVSEFPLGAAPLAEHFPRRNRVISALARGCLVVEAAIASGSLITARLAAEQGREVFAIPGSIHSPLSRGCHALIKQGAKLVESAADVLSELGVPTVQLGPKISFVEHELIPYMGFEPCDTDCLVQRSGLTAAAVSAMLLQLELEGKVGSLPGGLYQRLS